MSFKNLGLSEHLLKALDDSGYHTPTAIQSEAIPAILEGRDLMAAAQTGTGKTAGFTLPLLQRLQTGSKATDRHARALILTPTRELAAQVHESIRNYGKYAGLRHAVVFGGVKINPQITGLRSGADTLVATPGRLLDLFHQQAVRFDRLEVLVLDEADRMLDMGFIHDIRKILALLPQQRQNLLFSATFSQAIRKLAQGIINDPVEVCVTPRNRAATTVDQWVHPVDKNRKPALLSYLIGHHRWRQVLVFTRTKHGANKLCRFLTDSGIKAAAIHGNKSQGARTRALAEFKSGQIQALVATDIAARGLDIEQLPQVVNVDLPQVAEDYVHRIGRTGRAGAPGQAISLVSADEHEQLASIERLIEQPLNRREVEGFVPTHPLPTPTHRGQRKPQRAPKKAASSSKNGHPNHRPPKSDSTGARSTRSRRHKNKRSLNLA